MIATDEELLFSPLGGCGEIGRNLSLYGHDGGLLAVDCGLDFPPAEERAHIEAIMPDPQTLYRYADRIKGLLITHAHEDHLGAVPYLWGEKWNCPIYAPPFAARVLSEKWQREGNVYPLNLHVLQAGQRIDLAPFQITSLPVPHSVPNATALWIETPLGGVLHSGDWKLDSNPLIGHRADESLFDFVLQSHNRKAAFMALLCDSTNVFRSGIAGEEASTQPVFERLFRESQKRIVVTLFASNIARLLSIARAAQICGRRVLIAGTALQRMTKVARETGYWDEDLDEFLDLRTLYRSALPIDKSVIVATGSQGEEGSYMHRLAQRHSFLSHGDVAVFSSRTIPGNEAPVATIRESLIRKGVRVFDETTEPQAHVSGHAGAEEIARVYRRISPPYVIPIHGEPSHLNRNADLARSLGLEACVAQNGQILRMTRSPSGFLVQKLRTQSLPVEPQLITRKPRRHDSARWREKRKSQQRRKSA